MIYECNVDMKTMSVNVVETTTGNIMGTFNHDKYIISTGAKALCNHLNQGGGFDGNTPDFFMNRLKVTDVN